MATKAVAPATQAKNGLLPTPPMPKGLPKANLTDNARKVLEKRYVRRGDDGKAAENVEEMFWRVAYHVAKVEEMWEADVLKRAEEYYHLLSSKKFFPNSPTFTGAGTPLGQLAACFTGGMRVTTDQGVKRIDQLQIGDRMLTHLGHYRPVTHLFQRAYDGELLNIKIRLIGTTMEVTPEHPILTQHGWVKAGELKVGDKVAIGTPMGTRVAPVFDLAATEYADELEIQVSESSIRARRPSLYQNSGRQAEWVNRIIELTPDLARLCGYYVAEGTIGPDDRYVRFTFAKDELEYHNDVISLVEDIFGARVSRSDSSIGNWVNLNVYSRPLVAWLRAHFSRGSAGKHIPIWLQYAEREIQESFLIGVLRGDGMYFEKTYVISSRPSPKLFRALRLTLSNPGLVQQLWQLCLRLGYDAAIRPVDTTYVTSNASDTEQINMPPLQSRDLVKKAFGVELPEPDLRYVRNKVTRDGSGQVYFEVERINHQSFSGIVYNCEVDEDHTYVTEGVVVHNCFVLPITDDMGRDSAGIFQTLRDAALIQQTGGGNGFSFSRLRPKGAMVLTSAGQATGPVGFLRVYDHAFGEIAQGGSRRGANMAVLRVDHPDVEDFITCKINENQITNFNISVGITDAFMRAVKNNEEWALRFPDMKEMKNKGFSGTIEQAEAAGITIHTYKKVNARELFDKIVKQAHHNGEPGMLFLDAANRDNPVPHLYPLEATNPCHRGTNLVHTNLGVVPIKDLVGYQFQVVTPDGDFARATAYPTGIKPLFRVSLSNGATIDLTENHNLILSDGTKRKVNELTIGDQVKLSEYAIQPEFAANHFSEDEGFLLGWNAGDGWLTYHSNEKVQAWQVGFVFGNNDYPIAQKIQSQIAERIPVRTPELKVRPERGIMELATTNHSFVEYFKEELGAVHKSGGIPITVMTGNRDFQRGYLRGLFSADGYVSVKGKGKKERRQLGLVSAHEKLAKDVQILLSTFGIRSFIRHSESKLAGRDKRYQRWQVTVNANQFVRFMELIGFAESSLKQAAAKAVLQKNWRDTKSADYATVVSVEDLKITEDVYNITVDHPLHQFAVNGIISANCGEQWLGPYENCCLGSVNLNEHCGPSDETGRGTVDWELLRQSVVLSTRFLDDVVEANAYVPAVPQLTEAAHKARRIGLGIMGLADLMYHVGVRYGSKEGQEFGAQVMEFVRYHAMQTSVQLAEERGAFPAIEGSIYDMDDMKWTAPKALENYQNNWSRPNVEWDAVVAGIQKHGIRNAAQTTVAPTGTIATVAGCEGYGCEPVFALAYIRHVNDNGKDLKLTYASPRFDEALKKLGLGEEKRQEIVEQVMSEGTCQQISVIPQSVRDTFVVSGDISAEEHVLMQGALQAFVDNSLSKTVNFHENATEEDVAKAYMMAWELGCKGITVYVTGSRDKVVLETKATADKKEAPAVAAPQTQPVAATVSPTMYHETKKARPKALKGRTYNVDTPAGKAFITINENGGDHPFEAFINTAKAGSETAAVSEAIGRLISYILRMASPIAPTERMREVVRQLLGIGGGRSLGMGPNRVRSLPDGIGQVLDMYLREKAGAMPVMEEKTNGNGSGHKIEEEASSSLQVELASAHSAMKIGDLCPECGEAAVVNEEGCRKCYACGFSEC